jgi:hypothetical protein
MSNYENTYYEKFKEEYSKKYGTDFGYNYVGSAFGKSQMFLTNNFR